jgi:hypothetical protein
MVMVKVNIQDYLKRSSQMISNLERQTVESLKTWGDLAVQTITPDVPVYKGPARWNVVSGALRAGHNLLVTGLHTAVLTYQARNLRDGFNYAEIQHEEKSYEHDVGSAKYAEKNIQQIAHQGSALLARDFQKI